MLASWYCVSLCHFRFRRGVQTRWVVSSSPDRRFACVFKIYWGGRFTSSESIILYFPVSQLLYLFNGRSQFNFNRTLNIYIRLLQDLTLATSSVRGCFYVRNNIKFRSSTCRFRRWIALAVLTCPHRKNTRNFVRHVIASWRRSSWLWNEEYMTFVSESRLRLRCLRRTQYL